MSTDDIANSTIATTTVSMGLGIGIECHWDVIESIEQGLSAIPGEILTFSLCLLTKLKQ